MLIKKLSMLVALVIFIGSAYAQDYEYIGANKCKPCHNKVEKGEQYNKWANSTHAKAMESLKGDDAKNPKCLKCHSTAASVDADLLQESIAVSEGVSCESCHGPGSVYKNMKIMKDRELSLASGMIMPTAEVCQKCHNEESPTFKGFNYEEYVAKITHPDPSRE